MYIVHVHTVRTQASMHAVKLSSFCVFTLFFLPWHCCCCYFLSVKLFLQHHHHSCDSCVCFSSENRNCRQDCRNANVNDDDKIQHSTRKNHAKILLQETQNGSRVQRKSNVHRASKRLCENENKTERSEDRRFKCSMNKVEMYFEQFSFQYKYNLCIHTSMCVHLSLLDSTGKIKICYFAALFPF